MKQLETNIKTPLDGLDYERAVMLILDVRTRWSSTHQMMRKINREEYYSGPSESLQRTATL